VGGDHVGTTLWVIVVVPSYVLVRRVIVRHGGHVGDPSTVRR